MTVATKSENAEIAVLQDQMSTVKEDIREVKNDVKTLLGRFDVVLGLQAEIGALKVEVANLKAAKFRNGVIYPTVAAILGGCITALIILAITRKV